MKARSFAAVSILLVVCGFVIGLLALGVLLEAALIAAGAVGVVAAEIVRRLLPDRVNAGSSVKRS
jgi:hypothetical protein